MASWLDFFVVVVVRYWVGIVATPPASTTSDCHVKVKEVWYAEESKDPKRRILAGVEPAGSRST